MINRTITFHEMNLSDNNIRTSNDKDTNGTTQQRNFLPDLSGDNWNLEGNVYYVGEPCSRDTHFTVPPCSGPYPNYEIEIFSQTSQTIISRTKTDINGNFKTLLKPGNYIIYTTEATGISPSDLKKNKFTIEEGKITRLPLIIDAGIE